MQVVSEKEDKADLAIKSTAIDQRQAIVKEMM